MNSHAGLTTLVWQRLAASWRLLAVLAFGILVAATLLAAAPVYTRVMDDLGLRSALKQQVGSGGRDGFVLFDQPLGAPESSEQARRLTGVLSNRLSWLSASEVRYGAIVDLTFARPGSPVPTDALRTMVTVQTVSNFEDHVRVVSGRLPQATDDPTKIEVVVPDEAARYLSLEPGDQIVAAQPFNDCDVPPPPSTAAEGQARARFPCVPQASVILSATLTIAATVERTDPTEGYWSAAPVIFSRPGMRDDIGAYIPVILPEQSFYQALPRVLPNLPSQFRLSSFADLARIDSANLGRVRSDLAQLRQELTDAGAVPDLALAGPLDNFQARASFNQVPLLLLLLQVVGIAFYYVLLVASLLAERRAEETAVLRSRGAGVTQIVLLAAAEASCLAVVSALLAPFLASGAVAALGKTGAFHSISGGHFLDFTLVPSSFAFGLAGAFIAAAAVIIPTFFAARQGMALFLRTSARPQRSILQRYYLDFLLVGLSALAFWEMNQRGSVFDARSVGGWSADPLLLLSPLLLIVATGALMFRFLPLLLGLVSKAVAVAGGGAGLTLGLIQLTRSPARYTQLALLVVMAAAVGTFAATYGSTTEASQDQRALYQSGVDVRLTGLGDFVNDASRKPQAEIATVSGVEQVATAFRGEFTIGPLSTNSLRVPVLGVDPRTASSFLWFRDDFAPESLEVLMRHITGSAAGSVGLVLPGEPTGISVWVNPSTARPGVTLWARTLDAAGVFRLQELGILDFEGYRRLETHFSAERDTIVYPIAVAGLLMTQVQTVTDGSGTVTIDDIASIDPDGQETSLDDFEAGFRWDAIATATRNQDTVKLVNQGTHGGLGAAQISFRVGSGVPVRGIYYNGANVPLPAIASQRFLDRTGLKVGNQLGLIMGLVVMPVSIQGVTDLFPTMGDADRGFLILNQQHLYYYSGLVNASGAERLNEVWLRLSSDPATRASALAALHDRFGIPPGQIIDSRQVLESVRSDPLIRASGGGVLLIALLAASSLLALGFGLTLYLGGTARTVEITVLRAVGLSPSQVFVMIALEHLLVAVVGLAIGTLAGLRISETMLSFLNVTESGGRVVPPFALVTRWDTVALAFAATGLAFLLGVAALGLYFLRLPVSRVLRLTR